MYNVVISVQLNGMKVEKLACGAEKLLYKVQANNHNVSLLFLGGKIVVRDLFINAVILIAFVGIRYNFFRDSGISTPVRTRDKILCGIYSGALGIVLMAFSVHVTPSVILDYRNLAIVFAAIHGGIGTAVITGLLMGIFRVSYFGVNTVSIAALIVAMVDSVGCGLIAHYVKKLKTKWIWCVLWCLVIGSTAFLVLIKDHALLMEILAYYWIGTALVSVLLYPYLAFLEDKSEKYRKLEEECTTDFLTGLNNVRAFDSYYNQAIQTAQEKGEKLSLLLIDIDFFKKVNDTYGHAEGDVILKELGKILKTTCRSFDIISRNGGEEFSVLLLDCPATQAVEVAERIRTAVEKYPFPLTEGKSINITVSIGVVSYPDVSNDLDRFIEHADTALYRAKREGRNRVVLIEEN